MNLAPLKKSLASLADKKNLEVLLMLLLVSSVGRLDMFKSNVVSFLLLIASTYYVSKNILFTVAVTLLFFIAFMVNSKEGFEEYIAENLYYSPYSLYAPGQKLSCDSNNNLVPAVSPSPVMLEQAPAQAEVSPVVQGPPPAPVESFY